MGLGCEEQVPPGLGTVRFKSFQSARQFWEGGRAAFQCEPPRPLGSRSIDGSKPLCAACGPQGSDVSLSKRRRHRTTPSGKLGLDKWPNRPPSPQPVRAFCPSDRRVLYKVRDTPEGLVPWGPHGPRSDLDVWEEGALGAQ